MIRDVLAKLIDGQDLPPEAVEATMTAILGGEANAAQIAAFLVAMRMKGETAGEVAAAARVMRAHAVPVKVNRPPPILDTCGTGGDHSGSFNISTTAAIVAAACGVTVAKHGNRAASSRAGSADVLDALGVDMALPPERVGACIDEIGIGFVFARAHHPAMRHAAPVRTDIGVRTLFNLLGPLCNPAGPTHQVLGVADAGQQQLVADVLCELGSQGAWVVHGEGGLDEVSLAGSTRVALVRDGRVSWSEVVPSDFGVATAPLEALRGGGAKDNAAIVQGVLAGEAGPRRDAVLINTAAALCAAGVAASPREGAEQAAKAIDSGAARAKLDAWAGFH